MVHRLALFEFAQSSKNADRGKEVRVASWDSNLQPIRSLSSGCVTDDLRTEANARPQTSSLWTSFSAPRVASHLWLT